jgi:eukaryotic-like serine/threonine-protein kinase
MDQNGGIPPKLDPGEPRNVGLRTPVKGESSSPNAESLSDAPTFVGSSRTPTPDDGETLIGGAPPPSQKWRTTGPVDSSRAILEPGRILAKRYEVLELLGQGGMGAVYKARDLELSRLIALKVIRREYAGDRAIIDRFKQELILATQVTHKNVVRIYDLGEAEGVKFITMEYVAGEDLRTLLRERVKFPPAEAVEIVRHICRALDAAHSAGVIHRDLKPQNIMREKGGRILVMDFGLARTLGGDGMTQTGALVGTMEYMSPEQAMARNLDQRSDIYSLGLIFYELLTGATPFHADSALASLIKRTQEQVVPISQLDSAISHRLSQIVNRCLERDVALRYQTVSQLLADLDSWQDGASSGPSTASRSSVIAPSKVTWFPGKKWSLVAAGALLLTMGVFFALRHKSERPSEQQAVAVPVPARSLAILPLLNSSGDPKDDWIGSSVADMLSTDIGQSAHLHTISPDRLHQVLSDLRVSPEEALDPDTLRRVAQFSNADIVVSGRYARFGDQIEIDGTIRDLARDESIPVKARALAKDLPSAIDSLADSVRRNLSLSPDLIQELKAQSFKPKSASLNALRDYNEGVALMREGKDLDAYKMLQSATKEDPQFALALSRLADVQSELGFESDAEQSSLQAVALSRSENLPLPEKYLIGASNARILRDNKKAIEAYSNLAESLPGDVDVQYNLGSLYVEGGDYVKARGVLAKILQADPKNIKVLWQMGIVENILGNPQAALDVLGRGLNAAIEVDNQEQRALILLSMGISYQLLNKPEEALRNYQDSIAINEKLGQKRGVAAGLNNLANLQKTGGKSDAALATYNKALGLEREIGMKREAGETLNDIGTVYMDRGDYDAALQSFKEALQVQRDGGDQNSEALYLNNIATAYLSKYDTDNAFTYYQQALQLREKLGLAAGIAETSEGLGQAYTATGQYDQALTALMRALEFSRKAGDLRSAAWASHEMGLVYQYQGRFGAAIKSMQDAVKMDRDQGEQGVQMASFLSDLAGALAASGRGTESGPLLDEAARIGSGAKNETLMSGILNTKGDIAFYRGDVRGAGQFYQSALQLAQRAKDSDILGLSKLNVARTAIDQGRSKDAAAMLRPLVDSPTSTNAYLSIQYAVALAEAEIAGKEYARAEHDLQRALANSEKAGMQLMSARIYYLLGQSARLNGDKGQAAGNYREALRRLDGIRRDPGAEKILERADLKIIYEESKNWAG